MHVAPGTRFGPYEILAPIGAGGMGEVWKARDTRLDRSVAIKVLAAGFAQDAVLRTRFEREAKTISQLNHPNICSLFDVGDNYLVMELIEGESLADRLSRGPLPVSETLKVGAQVADALDRAHRAGIVHRDLKPGNIMLTKSGAKLLDFGLAKTESVLGPRSSVVETEHKPLTQEGTILGTFQYMAPEQLEGAEADARTDIFALGAVLYEMATGKRAFEGKTKTSLIAAIVQSDPRPIAEIQPLTPPAFEHVVRKCLAKDPDARWQSAHDISEELRWISEAGSQAGVASPISMRRKNRERLGWILVALAAAALGGAAALRYHRPEPSFTMSIPTPLHVPFEFMDHATLSPDGREFVFIGESRTRRSLWIREFDRAEPRELPGTDGAQQPFWSPDAQSVGFFADGKLKRVAASGGPPQVICDLPQGPAGGTWNAAGVIVFGSDGLGPLYRVSAAGGKPVALTKVGAREEGHRWPEFLPDGDHMICLGDASRTEDHRIKIAALHDGSTRDLLQAVTNAKFVEPDTLLFVRARTLLAQTFDPNRLALSGEPRVIAEQVAENDTNHHFEFSASGNGRLVYRSESADAQLEWVDRAGRTLGRIGEPRRIDTWRLAPDQQRVAVGLLDADGRGDDLWLVDPARSVTAKLTFDPAADWYPLWSPDGSRIAFSSMRSGLGDMYMLDVSNPAAVERLTRVGAAIIPYSWSRDRRLIAVMRLGPSNSDISLYSLDTHELRPYITTQFDEGQPALSPDGQWIAYVSTESGRSEVYVERFLSHANRRQISNGGGALPSWRGDGRELFYASYGGMLMAVDTTNENRAPAPLFAVPGNGYEAAADGKRFIIARPVDDQVKVPLTFVSNWRATRR